MARIEVNHEKVINLNEEIDRKRNVAFPYLVSPAEKVSKVFSGLLNMKKQPDEAYRGFLSAYKPYGNMINRPVFDLKWNNLGSLFFTMQTSRWPAHCRIMERDYYRCVSRVGIQNENKYCRIYREDVMECAKQEKSIKRRIYMNRMRIEKGIDPVEDPPKHLMHTDL